MGKKLKNDMSGRPHIEKIIHIHTFLQTLKFTSDLIQQSLMKAWKWYHLNGAGIMKPRIEDDVEVLQSAEENHQKFSKAPISDILELLKQTPFVENTQDDDKKIIYT